MPNSEATNKPKRRKRKEQVKGVTKRAESSSWALAGFTLRGGYPTRILNWEMSRFDRETAVGLTLHFLSFHSPVFTLPLPMFPLSLTHAEVLPTVMNHTLYYSRCYTQPRSSSYCSLTHASNLSLTNPVRHMTHTLIYDSSVLVYKPVLSKGIALQLFLLCSSLIQPSLSLSERPCPFSPRQTSLSLSSNPE